jgi:hypothetical protein
MGSDEMRLKIAALMMLDAPALEQDLNVTIDETVFADYQEVVTH